MAATGRAGLRDAEGTAAAAASNSANHRDQELAAAIEALSEGIVAVMSAMSDEVRFTDENEVAFNLLRRGCRHCSIHSTESMEALRQVPLEQDNVAATVVKFLARIAASRRGASRRVQELGAILAAASPPWSQLLEQQPVLAALLRGELLKAAADSEPAEGLRPKHEAHIFLRERRSQRFLSVTEDEDTSAACCVMTESAASMFICHWRGGEAEQIAGGGHDSRSGESDVYPELGFLHEGVPGFNCFLGCKRCWVGWELCCTSNLFGKQECFRWGADSSLQHFSTGLWLWVDPLMHRKITLHAEERSTWDVLLAT
eukprot:TRINITY_DN59866_c0_g1_i1.p1 TRINITY_DN59866_c0_g1~~TRINITY_DN59866_c0_g1_i1.p1  ORF type:complete len:315 (+),score=57.48 TRINITY_DN59866_c0_g1_i1:112-1056(+)